MELGIIIKNISAIVVVLVLAFLSQQPWVKTNIQDYKYPQAISNWLKTNVATKVQGGVSGGASPASTALQTAEKQIENQKNNFLQNGFDSARKFAAQEALNLLGVKPQDLGACKAN